MEPVSKKPKTEESVDKKKEKAERDAFVGRFDQLAEDVLSQLKDYNVPKESEEWIRKMLYYTIPGGKMNRGLSVIDTYRSFVNEINKKADLTPEEVEKCHVLGWCVEWLQAFFLIADDIMDGSITRRNQPCWYKIHGVGLVAINDSFIVESCIYKILKKYFRKEKYYVDLVELMHETTYQTELGQLLDLITAPEDQVDLTRFSMEKYKWIVKYKTAYYSFYLPVAMAMLMAGYDKESSSFETAEKILIEMGEYFQIQDDYLDCYGDPEVIGKIGTDIQDNKCSWLVNTALEIANETQLQILKDNYGKKDDTAIANVKALYRDLDLEKIFKNYEEESYKKISKMISDTDDSILPHSVFTKFMAKIYKRTK